MIRSREHALASQLAIGGSERVCQYACERTASCDAYNYYPTLRMCYLLSSVTQTFGMSNWKSALK